MPTIRAGGITLNYDRQGSGEPVVLIPYLAADHACYAFQVAEYAKRFTCISIDLRGTGESDKPGGVCRHIVLYWQGADWWGAGPGAQSNVVGNRWWIVIHPA